MPRTVNGTGHGAPRADPRPLRGQHVPVPTRRRVVVVAGLRAGRLPGGRVLSKAGPRRWRQRGSVMHISIRILLVSLQDASSLRSELERGTPALGRFLSSHLIHRTPRCAGAALQKFTVFQRQPAALHRPASGRQRIQSHGAAPPATSELYNRRRAPLAARQRLLRALPTKRQDGAAELVVGPHNR